MMKYLITFFLSVFCLSSSIQAGCFSNLDCTFAPGVYLGAFGGINGGYKLKHCTKARTNRGYFVGARAGKKFFSILRISCLKIDARVEGDFTWQWNDVHAINDDVMQFDHIRGTIDIWSLMTNAILDFNFNFAGNPFIGGGIGYAYGTGSWSGEIVQVGTVVLTDPKRIHFSFNERGFAWQIIAGLKFSIHRNVGLDLEYRYFKMNSHLSNHKFDLSLTYIY